MAVDQVYRGDIARKLLNPAEAARQQLDVVTDTEVKSDGASRLPKVDRTGHSVQSDGATKQGNEEVSGAEPIK